MLLGQTKLKPLHSGYGISNQTSPGREASPSTHLLNPGLSVSVITFPVLSGLAHGVTMTRAILSSTEVCLLYRHSSGFRQLVADASNWHDSCHYVWQHVSPLCHMLIWPCCRMTKSANYNGSRLRWRTLTKLLAPHYCLIKFGESQQPPLLPLVRPVKHPNTGVRVDQRCSSRLANLEYFWSISDAAFDLGCPFDLWQL